MPPKTPAPEVAAALQVRNVFTSGLPPPTGRRRLNGLVPASVENGNNARDQLIDLRRETLPVRVKVLDFVAADGAQRAGHVALRNRLGSGSRRQTPPGAM